ncbi:MAG: PrgI family protein [Catenulispora sp.]
MSEADFYYTSRIPRDIDRPDQVVGPLSFRQLAIIAGAAAVCWGAFEALHKCLPGAPVLALAAPLVLPVLIAAGIALGQRDGIGADRFLLAAIRYARHPRLLVSAPNGVLPVPKILPASWRKAAGPPPSPLRLPARGVDGMGVIDLAEHGAAGIAACSTVNFALRSAGEQNSLVGAFGRFLNALTGPTQILIRTRRIDLGPLVADLQDAAGALPHPALEDAAREHAAFLAELSRSRQLLNRQVLLAAREPAAGKHGGESAVRIGRRLSEAAAVLSGAQITVAAYTPDGAADLLADAIAGHTRTGAP